MNSAPLSSANDVRDAAYHRNQVKSLCFLALLAVVLVAAALLSLRAGSYNTPLAELVRGVFGLAQDEKINLVVQANRLPRICTAILGGAGLGLAGCILQAILNNPLASASTLGVSQGATFGAAFAIMTINNDVDLTKVLGQIHYVVPGEASDGFTILELSYSLGLAAGIAIFFNHFSRWKLNTDPTPLEVEMRLYEDNINRTVISNHGREESGGDAT